MSRNKITEHVRNYASVYLAEAGRRWKQGITENEALEKGLKEKSTEFLEKGAEVYAKV